MKKQSKLLIGITAGILLVAVVIIVTVLIASGSSGRKYAKHMETAQRYMDELQYEQAVAEYRAAIEIEPNNAEAYLALAEVYVQMGDYESALAVLEQGIGQTDSEELSGYMEEVRAAQAAAEEERSGSVESAEESGPREETVYNEDGSYEVWEYDADGKRVKTTEYNADGTLACVREYEYDVNVDLIIKSTFYNADGTVSSCAVSENVASGNMMNTVRTTFYHADGTLESVYEYDANGNASKQTYYNVDGEVDYYYVNEYDGNGTRVKTTNYNADGTVKWVDEYDANGNSVKMTFYNPDGTISDVFDGDGNRIE